MPTGPLLTRELLTASRRPQTYRQRCALAALMLLVMGWVCAASSFWSRGPLSVHELASLAQSAFDAVLFLQLVMTGWLVPVFVAGVIAGERERRTLGDLLTTRLSSAEIVLAKLAAGLLQYFACLATGFPIVVLLPLLGGVDPRVILLAYAGTVSTAVFLAGLSVLVSIHSPRGGQAVRQTIGLEVVWLALPFAGFLVPWAWPQLWPWVRPVNEWLMASTPTGVWLGPVITSAGRTFFEAVFWMIGLQLAAGILMIGWAVARLRAASRVGDGGNAPARARRWPRLRWRLIPRPSCGESPVLWKEIHTGRPAGFAELVGVFVVVTIFASIAYGCFYFGKPAALEWYAPGRGRVGSDVSRMRFNNYLRVITSLVELVLLIFVAGAAAEAVAAERARGTWDSLLATRLEGREILRDKMLGARWKGRWGVLLLVALWSVGLLTGSLHPLGVAVALAFLIVSTWFMTALGIHASLLARDVTQATTWVTATVVLLSSTFLACVLPSRMTSVVLGAGSMPFVNWLCLVDYRDVSEAVGQGTFNQLKTAGIYTDEGPVHVLATCLVGTVGYAAAAAWLALTALARFDRVIGRPERASAGDALDLPGRRSRRMRRAALVLPAGLLLLAGGFLVRDWLEKRALWDVLGELDGHSPGWRLDDVESARARVPEARNAALLVLAAGALIPPDWQGKEGELSVEKRLGAALSGHAPGECLKAEDVRALRAALDALGPALADARTLADLPDGRYRVVWTRDGFSTLLPHLEVMPQVATLLSCDALLRAHDGDADGSLIACRALLNAGRSVGDEPVCVSQLVRMLIREKACRQVEYTLAHGEPSDAALALLRRVLDNEETQPLLWWCLRGERGSMDRFVAWIDSGDVTPTQIRNMGVGFPESLLLGASATRSRTALLRYYSGAIEIAKLPPEEQGGALTRLEQTARDMPFAARMLAPALKRVVTNDRRTRAILLCASAALAAERYRLAHGHWPSSLQELVPELLARMPTDPFDGEPLRVRHLPDGVAIYSVGQDGRDDGGTTADDPKRRGSDDLAFRLWDVQLRHMGRTEDGGQKYHQDKTNHAIPFHLPSSALRPPSFRSPSALRPSDRGSHRPRSGRMIEDTGLLPGVE